jgi:thiol-disulfide isomerase/thioredoxin
MMTLPQRVRELFSWKRWRPDVWTFLLIGAIVYVWFRPPAWVSEENRAAPGLQVSLLDGRRLELDQLRGKVVLVNFWATWCPYCRHEMPAMESFYRDYQAKGFEIVALSQDDDIGKVAAFIGKEGYRFPVALAPIGASAAFGGVSRLPTSFVIDRRGRVRAKISGQVHYARLKGLIEPLLGE